MQKSVTVKSSRHGLVLYLDPNPPFEELLEQIRNKFVDSAHFFGHAKMAVSFEGRSLTKEEEQEILSVLADTAQIDIVCIVDNNEKADRLFRYLVEQPDLCQNTKDGTFYRGTLRRKEVLESDHSIILLGDVQAGAKVISKGNIIIIGSLFGYAYAGAAGNPDAYIMALSIESPKLRIADTVSRRYKRKKSSSLPKIPKIAQMDGTHIYIDPLIYSV